MTVLFRQLFEKESSSFTYLIADETTKEALLIDPVMETFDRDCQLLDELELQLKLVLETHIHADHITAASKLRHRYTCQIGVGKASGVKCADFLFDDGEEMSVGEIEIKSLYTPGHTSDSYCFLWNDSIFTGDTLLIRGCGRTDFQSGSNEQLYESVMKKLYTLPPHTLVYPGHDYKGRMCSSIGEEKRNNPRLFEGQTLEAFSEIMNNLNLDSPKKIELAVPANQRCGEIA